MAAQCGLLILAVLVQFSAPAFGSDADIDAMRQSIDTHYADGQFEHAEAVSRRLLALEISRFGDENPRVARTLNELGVIRQMQDDLDGARGWFEQALKIRESAREQQSADIVVVTRNLAFLHYIQGEYGLAKPYYARTLELYVQLHGANYEPMYGTLYQFADALRNLGDFAGARKMLERSLHLGERYRGASDSDVVRIRHDLARLLYLLGEYNVADALYEQNLQIAIAALGPAHEEVADSLYGLGTIRMKRGDHHGARELLERSRAILAEALGPRHAKIATILVTLAVVSDTLGDLDTAAEQYQLSLQIREERFGPESIEVASCLAGLAGIRREEGHYTESRELYERSLAITETVRGPDHLDVAEDLNGLAELLRVQGDYIRAQQLMERSLAIREVALGRDHPDIAMSLSNLAAAHRGQGNLEEARSLLQRGLDVVEAQESRDPRITHLLLNNLARVLQEQGDNAESRRIHERNVDEWTAMFGKQHPIVASAMTNLADALMREGDPAALPLYEGVLRIREGLYGPMHPQVAVTLGSLARWQLAHGDKAAARPLQQRSLSIFVDRLELLEHMSEREALAYVKLARNSFWRWMLLFQEPGDAIEVWSQVLQWKGVVTRRVRERRTAALHDPASRILASELASIRRERVALMAGEFEASKRQTIRERLSTLADDAERLERQLGAQSQTWRALEEKNRVDAHQVCAQLPVGTALVDFVRLNAPHSIYVAFVVSGGVCTVERVFLGQSEAIDSAIASWREVLADPTALTSRVDSRGRRVTEAVWNPIAPAVAGASQVILVPDGELSALPFAALPLKGGRYLAEERLVQLISDARDLVATQEQEQQPGSLFAVGGVDFGAKLQAGQRPGPCVPAALAPLPGTLVEVEDVVSHWKKGRYRKEPVAQLEGAGATEQAVAAGLVKARWAHLATHGYFADGCRSALEESGVGMGYDPMVLSGLALAGALTGGDDDGDGAFTAEEVALLDLRGTELVVLSACETGLGRRTVGEGVQGLQRGFSLAGAEGLVMSLWSVPDAETAELMDALYRRLLSRKNPLSPAAALRSAQLQMLSERRSQGEARPQDWAAFVYSGTSQ